MDNLPFPIFLKEKTFQINLSDYKAFNEYII